MEVETDAQHISIYELGTGPHPNSFTCNLVQDQQSILKVFKDMQIIAVKRAQKITVYHTYIKKVIVTDKTSVDSYEKIDKVHNKGCSLFQASTNLAKCAINDLAWFLFDSNEPNQLPAGYEICKTGQNFIAFKAKSDELGQSKYLVLAERKGFEVFGAASEILTVENSEFPSYGLVNNY